MSDSIGSEGGEGWILTCSGRRIRPLDPNPRDIRLVDVAWALSMKCRYNGHTSEFYSVAQHAVLVSHLLEINGCSPQEQLWGLHHDDSEAYLPDVARPIKPLLVGFAEVEAKVMAACAQAFGLDGAVEPKNVKLLDTAILWDEMLALMQLDEEMKAEAREKKSGIPIIPVGPTQAFAMFMERHDRLVWQIEKARLQ